MSEGLLTVLKFCFLALLYLFLFRVVRIVRLELKPVKAAMPTEAVAAAPVAAPSKREKKERGGPALYLLEPVGRHGESYALTEEVSVGRAPGCGVVLDDDTFVSQVHARLFRRGRETYVEDLGSTNGTFVNGERIADVTRLRRGDRVQFGSTVAEITVKLTPGGSTDKGQVRDGNEDGYVVDRRLQLFAVADGMGGHRGGEVASATALEALRAAIASGIGLGDAITNANTAVHDKAASDRELSGMGTTLTAVIPDGHGVLVGHVGDSRAYLLRDGELRQLTTDHSLVEELVREGRLTEQEAAVHPRRSIITRALGVEDAVDVDVYSVPLEAGDRLLLCSDGLTTMLRADDIAALLRRESDPTRAANLLVDAANAAGGEDNITTIVIDVEEDGIDPLAPAPVAAATTTATPVVPLPDPPATPGSDARPAAAEPVAEVPPGAPASGLPVGATAAKALADKARREKREERQRHPFRATGRFVRFAVPIILILGLAVAMTAWYARRTYFVAFDKAGQVTVYQGRPGGLLLWDPTVIRHSKLTKKDLPEDALVDVQDEKEFSNRGDAIAFAGRIEARATAATSTTTTPTTTTTTIVPSVVVPPPAT